MLVEEPEAHLHVQVQQVFIRKAYSVLRNHEKLGKSDAFSTQLVISTHSSHIAREEEFANLRYFKRYLRTLREKLQHLKSLIFLMFLVKMMQPNVLLQDICRQPTAICFLLMGSFWLRVQRNTCCCRILLGISSMR